MREIKFRAWDKKHQKMYTCDGVPSKDGICVENAFWGHFLSLSTGEVFHIMPRAQNQQDYREIVDFELMQYTGLKDKHGKEIYEGDVVRIDDLGIGIVDYEEGRFAMRRREERFCWPVYCRIDHSPFVPEVIGNIYENPELLGKQL